MEWHEKDLQRVCKLIRAYGASPDRWPAQDKHLAAAVADKGMAQLVREERALDEVLDSHKGAAPSQNLMNAVLTIPTREIPPQSGFFGVRLWPFRAAWQPASLATFALVAGIATGQVTQTPADVSATDSYVMDEEITVDMGTLALGDLYIFAEDQ